LESTSGLPNRHGQSARTYATLLEALNRHRGKGQQKVTVEHVHVHEGGQAIVGNLEGAVKMSHLSQIRLKNGALLTTVARPSFKRIAVSRQLSQRGSR
jgi:hypothetical protein